MSENCGISKISDANALDDEHSEMELLQFTREQYDFIQKQNFQLLQDLDKVEEEATQIHTQRIVLENENRLLKEDIIHTQQRARVAEIVLEEEKQKVRDQEQKLKIMAGQNAELLRLLDAEETQGANSAKISIEALHELGTLKEKYENLLAISSKNKELADHAAKKEELKTEEVRILRTELDQFQSVCLDLRIKMQVEVESLEEQLRARKEKQCVLLEQIQNLSKDSKALQNQVNELEETIRTNNVKTAELESQLQVALQSRNLTEENLKISKTESSLACQTIAGLQQKLQQAEMQRLHRDSEVQNSNEQLREMAEKVFQLLERLKLAEMAKTKAIEAMQRKEKEQVLWKKKATRLEIDSNKEGKAHYKVELDLQAALEQVLALKRHNLQLEKKFNEQSKEQIGKQAELTDARDKICSLEGRLSFVVNKMKLEEEARVVKSVEKKDLELQVKELTARIAELQLKLSEAGDSNRALFERIQLKEGEIEKMALLQTSSSMSNSSTQDMYGKGYVESGADGSTCTDDSIKLMQDSSDLKMVKISGGKGLFYTESKVSQGIILVRCRAESYRGWLEKTNLNNFLKKAQRSNRFKETIIDKLCQVYALLLAEQEEKLNTKSELIACNNQIASLAQTNGYLVDRLSCEIDAKYKTILR